MYVEGRVVILEKDSDREPEPSAHAIFWCLWDPFNLNYWCVWEYVILWPGG